MKIQSMILPLALLSFLAGCASTAPAGSTKRHSSRPDSSICGSANTMKCALDAVSNREVVVSALPTFAG
jgi:hypothetical protein